MNRLFFQVNKNIYVRYTLLVVIIALISLFLYIFIKGSDHFDYPSNYSNLKVGGKACGSGGCNRYNNYDLYGSSDEIIHFYNSKGYACVEVDISSGGALFRFIDPPYTQCVLNIGSDESRYIGFKDENIGLIKVSMWSFWNE
ncbi:hypothetical protein F8S13_19970 [Chloroflexia bacterium SDU3-3]|nr:hypothetical protein F8S13_19970 [Chloroflexia bacterium SDU3-3]